MEELAGEHLDRPSRGAKPGGARPAATAGSSTPAPRTPCASPWRGSLGRVIETEIIPRLLIAHRAADARRSTVADEQEHKLDLADFVQRLVEPRSARAREYVERALRGRTPEAVLLEVLAPAARRLGQLWESDHCDFVEVTVGMRRLHDAIRDVMPEFDDPAHEVEGTGHALFSPAPGETHIFGLTVVDRLFRRAGWRTRLTDTARHLDLLRREWFDIAGFSLSCERHVDALAEAVRMAKSASLNSSIFVLVGGPIFADHPELCGRLRADAAANDGPRAVQLARALLVGRARV